MNKTLIKQKENINNLLKLIKENPDIEILPMVAVDWAGDDSYGYWMSSWRKARLDKYWCDYECMYSYHEDFDSLVEEWIDDNFENYKNLNDDELKKLAEEKINNYDWTPAIIVYIEVAWR